MKDKIRLGVFLATVIAGLSGAVIWAACQDPSDTDAGPSSFTAARIVPIGCAPNDASDDRACIQDALDAACATGGGTVVLETGKWLVTRPASAPGFRDNASLWMECSNLALVGEGPGTVLMMTGDGLGSDWSAVRLAAGAGGTTTERAAVSDMTVASDDAFDLNEQTHLITLGSTVSDPGVVTNVQLHNLRLRHPIRPEVAGDCLRMIGEMTTPVSWVDVGSVVFESCDRSGWAVQRGVQHVNFHDALFMDIGKTAIDMEPSGTGAIQWIDMSGLDVHGSGISIAGQSSAHTTNVTLSNSLVNGRVGITYSDGVSLNGVHVFEVAAGSEGSLHIRGSSGIRVTGGSVTRQAGSVAGPALKLVGVSGTYSNDVTVTGMQITTEIGGDVVSLESAQDVTFNGNRVTGADSAASGIFAKALGQDLDRLQISNNRIRGPFQYAIKIAGSPTNVGAVQVNGNMSSGVTSAGLRCENPAKFLKPVVHGGYYYDGAAAAISGCTSVVTQRP